jgi:hypothetical protein
MLVVFTLYWQALAQHIQGTLFFAGEATTALHPASVHGEYTLLL